MICRFNLNIGSFMLNDSTVNLLSKDMCVDVNDLYNKLNSSEILSVKDEFFEIIDNFASMILSYDNDYKNKINEIRGNAEYKYSYEQYILIDSIGHAFISFRRNGLLGLWVNQENEVLYPRIIIREILEPNDIDKLENEIEIYRGCNIKEYNNKDYNQSWTTKKEIAQDFAYQKYESQSWFKKEDRCILQATIKKEYVYYAKQTDHECEIVVNSKRLKNIKIIQQG